MKLEVGKTYLDRTGRQVHITHLALAADGRTPHCYAHGATHIGVPSLRWWFKDGSYSADRSDSNYDLVQEVTAPVETKPDPIPHAELIRAVLDGKVLQHRMDSDPPGAWAELSDPAGALRYMLNTSNVRFRLKPEPVVKWCRVQRGPLDDPSPTVVGAHDRAHAAEGHAVRVLRLELDPDTLDLISARTEAP